MDIKNTPLLFQKQLNTYYKDILNCEIVHPEFWDGKVPETFFLKKRKGIDAYHDWGGDEVLDYTTYAGNEYAIIKQGDKTKVRKWVEGYIGRIAEIESMDKSIDVSTLVSTQITTTTISNDGLHLFVFSFNKGTDKIQLIVDSFSIYSPWDLTTIRKDTRKTATYDIPLYSDVSSYDCYQVFLGNRGKTLVVSTRYGAKILFVIELEKSNTFTGNEQVQTKRFDSVTSEKITGLYMSSDGMKIYTTNGTSTYKQYALTSPWLQGTSNTATLTSKSASNNADSLSFSYDGKTVYTVRGTTITQFELSTAWDLSTIGSQKTSEFIATNEVTTLGMYERVGVCIYAYTLEGTVIHHYIFPNYKTLYVGKYRDDINLSFKKGFQAAKGACLLGETGELRCTGAYENAEYKIFPVQNMKFEVSTTKKLTDVKSDSTGLTLSLTAKISGTPTIDANTMCIVKSHDGGDSIIATVTSYSSGTLTFKNVTSINSSPAPDDTGKTVTIKKGSQVFITNGALLKENEYAGCYISINGGASNNRTLNASATWTDKTKTNNTGKLTINSATGLAVGDLVKVHESADKKNPEVFGQITAISGAELTIKISTIGGNALPTTAEHWSLKAGQDVTIYNTRDGTAGGCIFNIKANTESYFKTENAWDDGGIPNYSTFKVFVSYGEVLSFIDGNGLFVLHSDSGHTYDYDKYEYLAGDGTGYVIDAEYVNGRIFAIQSNHNIMVSATEMGGGKFPMGGGLMAGYFNHSSLLGNVMNGLRVVQFNSIVLVLTENEVYVIKKESLTKSDNSVEVFILSIGFDFMGIHSIKAVCSYNTGVYILNDKNTLLSINIDESYYNRYKLTTEDMGIDIQQWLDNIKPDDKISMGINADNIYLLWKSKDKATVFIYDMFYQFWHRWETKQPLTGMHVGAEPTYLGEITYRYGLTGEKLDQVYDYTQHLRWFNGDVEIFSLKTILYHKLYLGVNTDLKTNVQYKARLSDGIYEYKIPLSTVSYLQKSTNLRGNKVLGEGILGYTPLGGIAEDVLIGTYVSDVNVLEIPLGLSYTLLEIKVEGDFETGGNILGSLVHDPHLTPYEDVVPYLPDN